MKTFTTLLFLFSLCAFNGVLFAHDAQEQRTLQGAYENGYARGYQHGLQDVRSGMNFDFRDDKDYQNTGIDHNTYDISGSCDVRVGYLEGYVDGYFRHQARFEINTNSGLTNNWGNNWGFSDGSPTSGGHPGSDASVVAFTQSRYSGHSQQFRPGQYPRLDGELNDSIDSITIRGNVRVILFDDNNFRGQRVVLDHDVSDLGNFKSKAASMIVESINR